MRWLHGVLSGVLVIGCACGRDRAASESSAGPAAPASGDSSPGSAPAAGGAAALDCGHAYCTDNLFVDAQPSAGCSAGATCSVRLTLVATGDYHLNDLYPYRFNADDLPGVSFLGRGDAGKNVFSKNAGDWAKLDPRSGVMTVRFVPQARGAANVAGVFKLSVCSGATCQLEQSRIAAAIAVN